MKTRALALAVLWIVGFELMPWMHIALHDHLAPHHHDLTGALVPGADPDHDHDADVDEHAADHDADHDHDAEVDEHGAPVHTHSHSHADGSRLASALAHGAHSLAHHGIAVPVPAPALLHPLPIDRRPLFVELTVAIAPVSPPPVRAVARGPPRRA